MLGSLLEEGSVHSTSQYSTVLYHGVKYSLVKCLTKVNLSNIIDYRHQRMGPNY